MIVALLFCSCIFLCVKFLVFLYRCNNGENILKTLENKYDVGTVKVRNKTFMMISWLKRKSKKNQQQQWLLFGKSFPVLGKKQQSLSLLPNSNQWQLNVKKIKNGWFFV